MLAVVLAVGTATGIAGPASAGATRAASPATPGGTWSRAIAVPGVAQRNTGSVATVNAISCATPGNCVAVGVYDASTTQWAQVPFVADERGGVWETAQPVPGAGALEDAADGPSAPLNAVSCFAPGDCVAGGQVDTTKDGDQAYAVTEHNWVWGQARLVKTGASSGIETISCVAAGACAAAGFTYPEANNGMMAGLVVDESGGTWGRPHQVPIPKGLAVPYMDLDSVSCAAAGDCTAVGYDMSENGGGYPDSSNAIAIIEANGTWGAAREVPGVAAVAAGAGALTTLGYAKLTGVSCPVAGDCTAVGTYSTKTGAGSLVATEAGGAWRAAVKVLSTAGGRATSVSCPAVGNCGIAGVLPDRGEGSSTFVASETSGSLGLAAQVPGLATLDAGGLLAGGLEDNSPVVSCAASGYCAVGGQYAGTFKADGQAFVAARTAAGWQQAQQVRGLPLLPQGTSNALITTMSCTATGYCSAGGYYKDSSGAFQAFVVNEATASAAALRTTRAAAGYGHEGTVHLTLSVTSPLGGTPAGRVTVKAGQLTLCTLTLYAGKGGCTLTNKQLKAGSYALTATYAGSAAYLTAVSPAVSVKVSG